MFVKCLQIEVHTVDELVYKWIRSIIGKVKWLNVSVEYENTIEIFSFCSASFIYIQTTESMHYEHYRK